MSDVADNDAALTVRVSISENCVQRHVALAPLPVHSVLDVPFHIHT
jgi:hypothetical protein